jgi:hypothetical protein
MLKSCESHGMRGYNFLRYMSKKATSRSFSYYPKFIFYSFWGKNFSNYVKNCIVLSKMPKKFYGLINLMPFQFLGDANAPKKLLEKYFLDMEEH